jgi:hypothetical protein
VVAVVVVANLLPQVVEMVAVEVLVLVGITQMDQEQMQALLIEDLAVVVELGLIVVVVEMDPVVL